jgi:hypothetical protein
MLINYIFYFYNVNYTSYAQNPYIILSGCIARYIFIFIFMVGFTLVYIIILN